MYGVFIGTQSPAPIGYARAIQRTRRISAPCSTCTPFGRPVVPDVYIT